MRFPHELETTRRAPHMDDHHEDVDGSHEEHDEDALEDTWEDTGEDMWEDTWEDTPHPRHAAQTSGSIEYRWVEELPSLPAPGRVATLQQSSIQPRRSLEFVVENGKRRPDGLSRRRIRAQARRKVETKLQIKRTSTPSPGSGACLRQGYSDPFDSLPIERNRKTQFLMHYYNVAMGLKMCTSMDPTKQWLLFATTDPALLHGVLSHAATHISMLRGKPLMLEGLYHKSKAIEIINKRLENDYEATSDATIATVAYLAYLECIGSSAAVVKVHMDGLEAIIKRRGGIEVVISNILVKKYIAWVDICASAILDSKPRFNYTRQKNTASSQKYSALLSRISDIGKLLRGVKSRAQALEEIRSIAQKVS